MTLSLVLVETEHLSSYLSNMHSIILFKFNAFKSLLQKNSKYNKME